VPRWFCVVYGLRLFWRISVAAYGGHEKLWRFHHMEHARFTAMAILSGTLRLRNGLSRIGHDEQLYNGASYTQWGFGVPLLEVPFHAVAARMRDAFPARFFPDRAIYFTYFALTVPILWLAFDRLLAMRQPPGSALLRRHALAWAGVLLAITSALFPLMSCRFIMYEETIAYMVVFELLALSAYVFALKDWATLPVVALGVASGIGLLIRPTGLICLGTWAGLVVLESRRRKPITVFFLTIAPFVALWCATNWVRSGDPFSFGFANSLPSYPYHVSMLRFGSHCLDTREHAWEATKRLFQAFFVSSSEEPYPWLRRCHFEFEPRPPVNQPYSNDPFFGVTVLALLCFMLFHQIARRDRRLADLLPYAALVFLFANYVRAGAGFCWRYEGDFWPYIVLACVQYVHRLPRSANAYLGWPLALVFTGASAIGYYGQVENALSTIELVEPQYEPKMWDDFTNSRYGGDPPLPNHLACGDSPSWPLNNGLGWYGGCGVDTFSNVYLGVPAKGDDHYALRMEVAGSGPPSVRVFCNGKMYVARRVGDTYMASVSIHYPWLVSPIVQAVVEWSTGLDAPPGLRFLSVELL
jgi:hypothetical protein